MAPSSAPSVGDDRDARLTALRAAAQDRLDRLDRDIAQLRLDRSGDSADDEHDPEGVTLSSEWARLTGLRDDAARELAEVDAARAHGATGDGARCADCREPIPVARLVARPTATRCVACAVRAGG